MSREKGCALFLLFALTLTVTSDAWAQRRKKSKPAAATPAAETQSNPKSAGEPSPALERAEKFYQRGDYYMASIEFNKAIEGEADQMMLEYLKPLYDGGTEPLKALFLKDLFELLEKVIDRCRDAGNVINQIVLKNT
jgi:hypothetical protein